MINYLRSLIKNKSSSNSKSQTIFYNSLIIEIIGLPIMLIGIIFKVFDIKGYGELLTTGALTLTGIYAVLTITTAKYEKFNSSDKNWVLFYRFSSLGSLFVAFGTCWTIMKWSNQVGYLIILLGLILLILVLKWSMGIDSKFKFEMYFQKRAVGFTLLGLVVIIYYSIKSFLSVV